MIVITTPTGQIGSQVLGNLLDTGNRPRIARDPSALRADERSRRGRGRVTWRSHRRGGGIRRCRRRLLAGAAGSTGGFC